MMQAVQRVRIVRVQLAFEWDGECVLMSDGQVFGD